MRRVLPLAVAALAMLACGRNGSSAAGSGAAPAPGADSVPASVRAPTMENGMLIVTPEDVRTWQQAGEEFVLIDARDRVQYSREHLPGAINVPYVDILPGADLPERRARVVVYCSDEDCPISGYAYKALEKLGYDQLYDMKAGLQGWKRVGYPTSVGSPADSSG